jgi:catechol 2,3-dioxygenase-like lactoylglutathione lyase family enzyme
VAQCTVLAKHRESPKATSLFGEPQHREEAALKTDKKLAHVVLQTTDLPSLKDWYLKVLDARVVYENEFIAFLTFDEEHHRLAIMQIPGLSERTPMTVGMAHSAYTFETLRDLMAAYSDLKAAGITPHIPVQHGVTTSLYYRDPDGNLVELQIDNFATAAEATDYMTDSEYATDPIGPSFVPDAMLKALDEGAVESELTSRAWAKTCPQVNVVELMLT